MTPKTLIALYKVAAALEKSPTQVEVENYYWKPATKVDNLHPMEKLQPEEPKDISK